MVLCALGRLFVPLLRSVKVADETAVGVGKAVCTLLRDALQPILQPMLIELGEPVPLEGGGWRERNFRFHRSMRVVCCSSMLISLDTKVIVSALGMVVC